MIKRQHTFQQKCLEFLEWHEAFDALSLAHAGLGSRTNISGTDNAFGRPSGTGFSESATQALRAWLRSARPAGTKAIRPPKGLADKLAPMGENPALMALFAEPSGHLLILSKPQTSL
jgi:hypothetical protein